MKKHLLALLPIFIISCSQDNPITVKDKGHSENETIDFKLKIENVSKSDTLKLSNGKTESIILSSGTWVIYSKSNPLFINGQKNNSSDMEKLAEDGIGFTVNPKLVDEVSMSGLTQEIKPNSFIEIPFKAKVGDKLSFATMLSQSNDLFYSTEGIDLFDKDKEPIKGDLTSQVFLWDLGTEVNQELGLGDEQGARQKSPNFGKTESDNVKKIEDKKDGFNYPKVVDIIKVTLTNEDKHDHKDGDKH
ncbi:MAG: spondin domain-containing protein [Candidatus Sericytochromatia bacterium]